MTREIVVNGRFLSRRVTGVERYGLEILKRFNGKCRVEKTPRNGITGHAWEQFTLPRKLNPDSILWSPANTGPVLLQNQALTIHDLSPLEHPEWFQKNFALWYRLFLPILAKRVRMIFTPSEYAKGKITKRFGIEKIIVTPNGVDVSVFHPDAKTNLDLPKKYILFVGSLQPRKNLKSLFDAWKEIKCEFAETWLIIAGDSGNVFQDMKYPQEELVRFLGYVPENDLPGLYAQAECFVLPSFDEGFGLPALEAMACGTPVIVSDGGALPEVVGDAGLVFRLTEPHGLREALRKCLTDPDLRISMKERGLARAGQFSWNRTAELIWKTLHEL